MPIKAEDGKNPDTFILVNKKNGHSIGITFVNSKYNFVIKYSVKLNRFGFNEKIFYVDLIEKENLQDFDIEFIKEKYFKNYLIKLNE